MNIYKLDANSPYQTFRAGVNLTETFRAVQLTDSGVVPCGFNEIPCGILMSQLAKEGEDVYILVSGGGRIELGEDVTAGDLLTIGDDGLAYRVVDGDYIFARALQSGTAGSVIQVVIIHAGYVEVFFDDDEEWNVVKIFFGFPISRHRRYRGISLLNPRDDLTREEIKAAGQYGVDNKLILNAAGEVANRVIGAALKRKTVEVIRL